MEIENKFAPIYEKDGMEFLVAYDDFVGNSEREAREIGWGSMLLECILWECKFTNKIVPIKGLKGREAELGINKIFILGKNPELTFSIGSQSKQNKEVK